MEMMRDVTVHSEHSLVDERGFGGISVCYIRCCYIAGIWYSYRYFTVISEGDRSIIQLRVVNFTCVMKVVYPLEVLRLLSCLCKWLGLVTNESSGLVMVGRYKSSIIVLCIGWVWE